MLNYVAHARLNDQVDAEGGQTFIEEIQSDRHQAGGKKGIVRINWLTTSAGPRLKPKDKLRPLKSEEWADG